MKRFSGMILAVLLLLSLTACGQSAPTKEDAASAVTVRLGALKGPTAMGMAGLFETIETGTARQGYAYQLAGSADELTPLLLKGDLDIAAVPANLAAILYNNTDCALQMLAVNTLGVLYLVEKGGEPLTDWESLRGETIYSSGKGSSPEYVLNYLLEQNGLTPGEDVTIAWKNEHAEVVAQLAQMDSGIAMLPQPFVTVAQSKIEGLTVAMDLTEEWDALDNGSQCITGCLVIRREFAEENPDAVSTFLAEYADSTSLAAEDPAACSLLIEKYGILESAAIAEKALPYCNIVDLAGAEMRDAVSGYLQVLFDANPKSVGGKVPENDFYYGVK